MYCWFESAVWNIAQYCLKTKHFLNRVLCLYSWLGLLLVIATPLASLVTFFIKSERVSATQVSTSSALHKSINDIIIC